VAEATRSVSAEPLGDVSRISLNQITINRWTLAEAVDGCARQGIGWIGLWRDKVADTGLNKSARLVRDAGLQVSSLCRGGFFPARGADALRARREDNRRAVDEAAALDTAVCTGPPARASTSTAASTSPSPTGRR